MSDERDARILAALEQLRDDLAGQLVQLRADVMARIDRLQDALAAQRDADAVNFGAAERAEKIALRAREEVRAMGGQVNAMVRQIQRLQSKVRQLKGEH